MQVIAFFILVLPSFIGITSAMEHFKNLKKPEDAATDLNEALNAMAHWNGQEFIPKNCFCCDRSLLALPHAPMLLSTIKENKDLFSRHDPKNRYAVFDKGVQVLVPEAAWEHYSYNGPGKEDWMEDIVMSPRSAFSVTGKRGFLCCDKCRNAINKDQYPTDGILNQLVIGDAPEVLKALNTEELAAISLVRNTAHIITYMGGPDKQLQGWQNMVEVKVDELEATLRGMNHPHLNFPDSIYIVLTGPMTEAQQQKARAKTQVSVAKMRAALDWLIANNIWYKERFPDGQYDPDTIPKPIIIDKVDVKDSIDTNIELTEETCLVFPDSTLDETTGGCDNVETFKEVIALMNRGNTAVTVTSRASKYVYANRGENFAKAFPLQYPFGIGGPSQKYTSESGKLCSRDLTQYLQHVGQLSNPNFHSCDFAVIAWNVMEKEKMMKRTYLRLKNDRKLQNKIANCKSEDMRQTIEFLRTSQPTTASHETAKAMLDAVEGASVPLSHGNGAAKTARKQAFAMQTNLGLPFIFFTVAPDESTSYTVTLYYGIKGQNVKPWDRMSDKELKENAMERHRFRVATPGMTTLWYRAVMDAIWKHVIGFDWKFRKATAKPGIFGIPIGAMESTEEQSRHRLHAHCLVWIKGAHELLQQLQTEEGFAAAEEKLKEIMNRTISVNCLNKYPIPREHYPHEPHCNKPFPQSVPLQHLRDMRHKAGELLSSVLPPSMSVMHTNHLHHRQNRSSGHHC
jgi:hypothetical protein